MNISWSEAIDECDKFIMIAGWRKKKYFIVTIFTYCYTLLSIRKM